MRKILGRRTGHVLLAVPLGLLAALAAAYFVFTGPADLETYPNAATSPYRLPYPAGKTWLCVQSNRGIVSHQKGERFAYDFAMPEESEVCAAREGEVVAVVQHHDGHGYRWPNNKVVVRHDDGTLGAYLHIRKDGSLVAEGDRVARGQAIALSGHVGNSMLPHLHFHVSDPARGETVPVSFADVARHRGVPRMFCRYTSGNAPTP
ncbi:MAG TPA: M23 family metallopeptidase [Candidatus Hydrogenedentes bacterium]|nr:M23 family metallopeptidase [Candidatus Hydrogenedentota bacterium]HOH51560.1 M23 family metallopeptidase [Candidatus Hydrogenedentota bacterium]